MKDKYKIPLQMIAAVCAFVGAAMILFVIFVAVFGLIMHLAGKW